MRRSVRWKKPASVSCAYPVNRSAAPPSAPRPDRTAAAAARLFGPSQLLVGDPGAAYASDASETPPGRPGAVIFAESQSDLPKALALARDLGVPLVPRAAGTGKVGGATAIDGCIVLCTHRLRQLVEIDRAEQTVLVDAGLPLQDLQEAVEREGLFFPPDPHARSGCLIGGNVATNAGGPRAFKYGVTGRYVLGLEAFLMGGTALSLGRATAKGVTGYDVAQLLVGSEGTLAVFGRIRLRLLPPPEARRTSLLLFADILAAARAVGAIVALGGGPSCLELLDLRLLPKGAQALEAVCNSFEPGARAVFERLGRSSLERAEAGLLVEVDGSLAQCAQRIEQVGSVCDSHGASAAAYAQSAEEARGIWGFRSGMSATLRGLSRHKLSEDVAVPRTALPRLLSALCAIDRRLAVRTVAYGHAGDGNLHVNFLWDEAEEAPRVQAAIEELFRAVVALGGTLSGEHGIGVLKRPYLPIEQSLPLRQLQAALKRAFDPQGLLNPGKILGGAT